MPEPVGVSKSRRGARQRPTLALASANDGGTGATLTLASPGVVGANAALPVGLGCAADGTRRPPWLGAKEHRRAKRWGRLQAFGIIGQATER